MLYFYLKRLNALDVNYLLGTKKTLIKNYLNSTIVMNLINVRSASIFMAILIKLIPNFIYTHFISTLI